MTVWLLVKKWFKSHVFHLSNRNLIILSLVYVALSWVMLKLAGEQALTQDIATFVYYLMVTASTVGYGDLSPSSNLGKWIVVLFVIPGGLSLFAALLGRVASGAIEYWRAGILGKRRVSRGKSYFIVGLE